VMNVQREVIYRERRRALMGSDVRETTLDMAKRAALGEAEKNCPRAMRVEEWDTHKLFANLCKMFGATNVGKHLKADDLESMTWLAPKTEGDDAEVEVDDGRTLSEIVDTIYQERESELGEYMRGLERWLVTRTIDEYWMEHLAEMDYLRDAIWQEGYAQKEPIGVYRQEAFAMFQKMLGEIRREVSEGLFAASNDPQPLMYQGQQMSGMQEERLLQTLPFDDDGFDDGAMLEKDADGDDTDEPQIRMPSHAATMTAPVSLSPMPVTQTSNGASQARPSNGDGGRPNGSGSSPSSSPSKGPSRAERRAGKKNKNR